MGIVGWKRKKEKRGEYRTNKHRISPQHEMLRLRRGPETGVVMLHMAGPAVNPLRGKKKKFSLYNGKQHTTPSLRSLFVP